MNEDNENKFNIHGSGITPNGIKEHSEELIGKLNIPSKLLQKVLETSEKIKIAKSMDIRFSSPIMRHNNNPVIFPNTIVAITGQAASHKSRIAETICSAMLSLPGNNNELLGFRRDSYDSNYTVILVDTERNHKEQLPFALQSIQLKAGYNKGDHPPNFRYASLLEVPRKDRFNILNEYLDKLKQEIKNPMFIVLDVLTDCVEDFNRPDKSLELIDSLNIAVNEYDVVFVCVIHQNPQSEKMRGHLGTELLNKSSTTISTAFEKDSNNQDLDLLKIKFQKCRSTARHTPFYAKYSEEHRGLVLADIDDIQSVTNSKKQKADAAIVIEHLEMYLGDGTKMMRRTLLDKLISELGVSEKTLEDRLKEICTGQLTLENENGLECYLEKDKSTREIKYHLVPKNPVANKKEDDSGDEPMQQTLL